jgi:hypothetical protein
MRFSSTSAAKRVIDVVLDCLIVLLAFVGVVLALVGSRWAPLWVLISVVGMAGQLVQTALERTEEWSPLGRSLVLQSPQLLYALLRRYQVVSKLWPRHWERRS